MSVYLLKKVFHTGFLLIFIIINLSCSTTKNGDFEKEIQPKRLNLEIVRQGDGPKLSEALLKNVSSKKPDQIPKSRRDLLAVISKKSNSKNYRDCVLKFKNAPECLYLKPDWNDEVFSDDSEDEDPTGDQDKEESAIKSVTAGKAHRSRGQRNRIVNELYQKLKKGEVTQLSNQKDGDYYRALKSFHEWTPALEMIKETLLSGDYCSKVELYHYLAMKSEEFFPDEIRIETARKLYQKVDDCGDRDSSLQSSRYLLNSRFRLGLLSIMNENFDEAQRVFAKLVNSSANDFSSRAHFWNAYCSKVESKREGFFSSYEQLNKLNPIGFHTLLMTRGESHLVENLSQPIDPVIKTRVTEASFNNWIETIEDLDLLSMQSGIKKLLSPVRLNSEYLENIEPGVRLYLATFAHRARDSFSLFRILDSVFRSQNEYVLDSTLKLFYPLKYLDSISEKVSRVNPFVITALIRQESAFHEAAKSKVGAVGLMQLMPRTARLFDRKITKKKLLDPETNLRIGIRYFENLVERFEGDIELALAAYNAGPEAVDRWRKRYPMSNRILFLDLIPYSETRNYVSLIGRNYYWYSKVYSQSMSSIADHSAGNPLEFRTLSTHAK